MKLYVVSDEWYPVWIHSDEEEYKKYKSSFPHQHRIAEVDEKFYIRYLESIRDFLEIQGELESRFIDSEKNDEEDKKSD